jgi:putative membrane protein
MFIARLVWNWLLNSLVLALIIVLIPAIQFATALDLRSEIRVILLAGLILGILNTFVKPLLKLLSLPLILITGGLFLIIINVIILMLVTWIVPELIIPDFITYLIAAILLGILNTIENLFFV